jgi:hypothetical protein
VTSPSPIVSVRVAFDAPAVNKTLPPEWKVILTGAGLLNFVEFLDLEKAGTQIVISAHTAVDEFDEGICFSPTQDGKLVVKLRSDEFAFSRNRSLWPGSNDLGRFLCGYCFVCLIVARFVVFIQLGRRSVHFVDERVGDDLGFDLDRFPLRYPNLPDCHLG